LGKITYVKWKEKMVEN